MKHLELGTEVFEIITSRKHPVAPITGCNTHDIYKAYANPSQAKVAIWQYWCNWCGQMQDLGFECGIQIESHNCHCYTITGILRVPGVDGAVYDLWITKEHNRAYKHN